MELTEHQLQLKPLTHLNGKTGQPYRRDPLVDGQIAAALQLTPADLTRRASLRDRHDPDFLREETLVYLIREFNQSADGKLRRIASDLSEQILIRCDGFIMARLRGLGVEHLEEAADEVVVKLFSKIADVRHDLADFAQVAFWEFVNAVVSELFWKHVRQLKRERNTVSPAWVHGGEPNDEEIGRPDQVAEPTSDAPLEMSLLTEELLGVLSGHLLLTMRLHLAGWPVESKFADEPTISRYFGKTPRTIRNWMREAEGQLAAAWRRND